jgi:hypothetical protein
MDLITAAKELLYLHMCEQEGLSLPTREEWIKAVDDLGEALANISEDKSPIAEYRKALEEITEALYGQPTEVNVSEAFFIAHKALKLSEDKTIDSWRVENARLRHELEEVRKFLKECQERDMPRVGGFL